MYSKASQYINDRLENSPRIGLILGSGLGVIGDYIKKPIVIPYRDIPGFPRTTVKGHRGQFICGEYQNRQVIAMQGRFHYYEGKGIEDIVLPVRVYRELGVDTIIVTNAAGGINKSFTPGDIMIITDHINFSGINPLRGRNDDRLGPRFPDMSKAYSDRLMKIARQKGSDLGISLREGVYAMMPGPSYETPAEINMLRILGADAVGMSTVPEVIAAIHAGIEVLGLSCITNMAAGVLDKPLDHSEVIDTAEKAKMKFSKLIEGITAAL